MDERNPPLYALRAPGASERAVQLPGRATVFPALDDHLVVPEVTRDEVIKGRRVIAQPAQRPHARQHSQLDFVVRGLVAPGHETSSDLLTRIGEESDFASDACLYKVDAETDERLLEELAFEVVSTQSVRDVTDKADAMQARGVRRIFAIFVKKPRRVCEWSAAERRWEMLDPASRIEDPCLVTPLPVAALLDAAMADNAVAKALIVKRNPVILQEVAKGKAKAEARGEAKGKAIGEAQGKARSILRVLEKRGLTVSPARREEILACVDAIRLDRWLDQSLEATTADELFEL